MKSSATGLGDSRFVQKIRCQVSSLWHLRPGIERAPGGCVLLVEEQLSSLAPCLIVVVPFMDNPYHLWI